MAQAVETSSSEKRLDLPDLDAVLSARDRIRRFVHRTPVVTCETLDRMSGSRLFMKAENFQKAGAFKYRGATNAVQSLSGERSTA